MHRSTPQSRTARHLGPVGALILWICCLTPGLASAEPHTYTIDKAHSSVAFEVRHLFTPVPGRFTAFDGRVTYDADRPEASSVYIAVQADSVDTRLPARDQHLKSADFFAADEFPQITFRSREVSAIDDRTLRLIGDLTLRGTTRELTLTADILGLMAIDDSTVKAGFSTEFEIDRKEFGVSWNRKLDQGGFILGDTVKLRVILQLDRSEAGPEGGPTEASDGP